MAGDRVLKLALIGTVAGVYSGLFGVGGGSVIVPLLVLWLGFDHRLATGTSLAAIAVIALFAALFQGAYGNVNLGKAALVGLPALPGVLAGTAIQQRLREQVVMLLFAGLLLGVAVDLVLS
jgi:uncharacterized membrane protein YfcA